MSDLSLPGLIVDSSFSLSRMIPKKIREMKVARKSGRKYGPKASQKVSSLSCIRPERANCALANRQESYEPQQAVAIGLPEPAAKAESPSRGKS
jgi:hypothetical protein